MEGERPPLSHQTQQPPLSMMYPEDAQEEKAQDTGVRELRGPYQRVIQDSTSSHTKKSAKFLNLRYLLFFN